MTATRTVLTVARQVAILNLAPKRVNKILSAQVGKSVILSLICHLTVQVRPQLWKVLHRVQSLPRWRLVCALPLGPLGLLLRLRKSMPTNRASC